MPDRYDRADWAILSCLELQTYYQEFRCVFNGAHIGIIGAGPSLQTLDLNAVADEVDIMYACNDVAQHLAAYEWKQRPWIVGNHHDDIGRPLLPYSVDMMVLSTRSARHYRSSRKPRLLQPHDGPLRPTGSQAITVWISRLLGAARATLYACDSVTGACARVDSRPGETINYLHHPRSAKALARDMPVEWRHPAGDPPPLGDHAWKWRA